MRFLLLNDPLKDLLDGTRSFDRAAVGLAADQDEDTGCDGDDIQNDAQASQRRDQRKQTKGNQEDGQQQKADILSDFQGEAPFLGEQETGVGSAKMITR